MNHKDFNPLDYIPKPCKEDWHQMTGDEKRRHCEKCDTHVVDLTGMSKAEILKLRKNNGGKLCGAFRLSSSLAKPLALGTGIASLALAACENKREIVVPGVICPPPAENEPNKKKAAPPTSGKAVKKPSDKLTTKEEDKEGEGEPKPIEIDNPPLVLGKICVPPPKPGKGPF